MSETRQLIIFLLCVVSAFCSFYAMFEAMKTRAIISSIADMIEEGNKP